MLRWWLMSDEKKKPYHDGGLPQKLVEKGLEALMTTPADQVSVRELTEQLDRAPSAANAHFRNKGYFLAALAAAGFDELTAMTFAIGREVREVDRQAKLIEGYVAFALTKPHLYDLMFSAVLPTDDAALNTAARASFQALEEVLAHDGIAGDAGVLLWASLHGLVTLAKAGRLKDEGDRTARLHRLGDRVYRSMKASALLWGR